MKSSTIFTILLLVAMPFIAFSQVTRTVSTTSYAKAATDSDGLTTNKGGEEEITGGSERINNKDQIINNYNFVPKSIPTDFSGYKVQIYISNAPLPQNHHVFNDFGKLNVENTSDGFLYTVGDFTSQTAASEFLEKIIGNRYDAKVIRYEQGVRVAF